MLTFTFGECQIRAPYAECRYDECHYAGCRYGECHYAERHGAGNLLWP